MTGKPKKTISILLLLLLFTVLFGMLTITLQHRYSRYKLDQLTDQIENNQQRIRIGSYIVEDLKQVESDFFRLFTFNHPKSRQLTVNSLNNKLAEISSLLQIIKHGGNHVRLIPLNLAGQDSMTIKIHYQPEREKKFFGEILSLKSMLSEIKEKISLIDGLLKKDDNDSFHLTSGITFLRETESYFIRTSERAHKLLYDSNLKLQALRLKISEKEQHHNMIEMVTGSLTLIIVLLLGGLISRKITLINLNLEKNMVNLQKSRQDLTKANIEWETTFNSIPDAIAILDLNHRIVRVNQTMGEAFKLKPGQHLGQPCYKLVHGTDQPPAFCPHNQLLKDGREHSTEVFIEQLEHYFLVTVSPIFDDDAKLTGSLHIARDITDQKKLAHDLQKSHDNLGKIVAQRSTELQLTHQQLLHSEKLSAIGRLSASIAHEINNPLFGVMTILSGLEKREELSNKAHNAVELALSECKRVKKLISNLQDFHRPTPGRFASQAINQLIDEVLLLTTKEFENHRLHIIKEYADNLPEIKIVADQIKQVLLNLLQNAIDASPPNTDIKITTKRLNNQLTISIKDQGCGITPENQQHIFEPFFTTKSEVKGTGLGLSVSFGIIKSHNGEIKLKSSPDRGSTFTILLPLKKL